MGTRRAVFLDRDGVLNRAIVRHGRPFPPASLEELEILPGVAEACGVLGQAGFLLVVVSNQPDVARGHTKLRDIGLLNDVLMDRIPLDAVLVCPHDDDDRCHCRKPAPGLLFRAARRLRINLGESIMVGDRWRDIEAGRRAGCTTVFIDAGYAEQRPVGQDLTVACLADAVPWMLRPSLFTRRCVDDHRRTAEDQGLRRRS